MSGELVTRGTIGAKNQRTKGIMNNSTSTTTATTKPKLKGQQMSGEKALYIVTGGLLVPAVTLKIGFW